MADERSIVWRGQSGKQYRYWIYPLDQKFTAQPANYMYAKEVEPGSYSNIYIGETGDLSDSTLDGHHKEDCIRDAGVTHIHTHMGSGDEDLRQAEEADLVANYNPPCNR